MASIAAREPSAGGRESTGNSGWNYMRRRITTYFLLVALLPTVIIGALSCGAAKSVITRKIADYSLAELTSIASNTQTKITGIENISMQLFIDKEFNGMLSAYVRGGKTAEMTTYRKAIEGCLNEYVLGNQDIFALACIVGPDAKRSVVVAKDYQAGFLNLVREFATDKAYQDVVLAGGGLIWSPPLDMLGSHFVLLCRYLKDMATGEPLGVLAIAVDEDSLDRLINMSVYNRLQLFLGEVDNYSMIVDRGGEIVSTPYKSDIGKKLEAIIPGNQPWRRFFSPPPAKQGGGGINQGSLLADVNGRKMMVTYRTIGTTGVLNGKSAWLLLNLTPTSYMDRDLRVLGLSILGLAAVLGILVVLFSFYVSAPIAKKT